LTVGLAPGGRADDYFVAGSDFSRRGKNLDAQLELLHRAWQGQPVGVADRELTPALEAGRVPVLIGGATPPSPPSVPSASATAGPPAARRRRRSPP